jgi:hypothetical protein
LIGDSNVQVGDIVTSINGYDFVAKPDSLVALDIVRNAREIRFSFQIPALDPAMDHLSLPTLPQVPASKGLVVELYLIYFGLAQSFVVLMCFSLYL